MSRAIFPAAYFAGVILTSAVRVVYTRRYRQTPIARDYRKGMDALLSALPGLGMFVLPVIYVLTGWLDFADYHLPVWAGWLGVVLFALAVWLLWRSHADLEDSWSPRLEIMEGHSLVTQGVFRHIRHPMYAAHWLWWRRSSCCKTGSRASACSCVCFRCTCTVPASRRRRW